MPPNKKRKAKNVSNEKSSKIKKIATEVVKTEPISENELDHNPELEQPSVQCSALVVHSGQSFLESLCNNQPFPQPKHSQSVPSSQDTSNKVNFSLLPIVSRDFHANIVDGRSVSCDNVLSLLFEPPLPSFLSSYLPSRTSYWTNTNELSVRWSPDSATYMRRHAKAQSTIAHTPTVAIPQIEFASVFEQRKSIVSRRGSIYLHESQFRMDKLPEIILSEQTIPFDAQHKHEDTTLADTPMLSATTRCILEPQTSQTSTAVSPSTAVSQAATLSSSILPVCKPYPHLSPPDNDDSDSTLSACEEMEQSPTNGWPSSTPTTRFLDTLYIPDGITIIAATHKRDTIAASRLAAAEKVEPDVILTVQRKDATKTSTRIDIAPELPLTSIFDISSALVAQSTASCISASPSSSLADYLKSNSSNSNTHSKITGMPKTTTKHQPTGTKSLLLNKNTKPSTSAAQLLPTRRVSANKKNPQVIQIVQCNGRNHTSASSIVGPVGVGRLNVSGPNVSMLRMPKTSCQQQQQVAR